MLDNAQKARGDMKPLRKRTYVEHLSQFMTEVNVCIEFAAKKAIIIYQRDYSLTRLLDCNGCKSLTDLTFTKEDERVASYIAQGFGIADKDITHVEDSTVEEIDEAIREITDEFKNLGAEGKRTFLLIYCASRGVIDRQQYLILNCTSSNLYNIE